jgi:hypothetical protein
MVRQLFEAGIVQSGFWHRFAMTAHSPVGLHPAGFDVMRIGPDTGLFADNDLDHEDPLGCNHSLFSEGLRKSLFNYMHGVCFEFPLKSWFDFKTPPTSIPPNYIAKSIRQLSDSETRPNAMVIWLGSLPSVSVLEVKKGNKVTELAELVFFSKKSEWTLETSLPVGEWLELEVSKLVIGKHEPYSLDGLKADFEAAGLGSFGAFMQSATWRSLRQNGLLIV